ncbi:FAD-dependent oxidoreductase, partial [Frankia sp. AiPs1]|nr:FAD-dependent oxidoreductase [Frankia sp. AiPs1]
MTSDRSASIPRSGHAVVLGAGVAGLLAARVLSETFGRVSVLDRDDLPGSVDGEGTGLGVRRGVPQAGHLHALMDRGREILEDLHPGLVAQLVAAGAPTSEALVGGRWYLQGRRVGPVSTGLTSVLASRPLLERELRRRTAALPGVRLLPRTAVIGLVGVEAGGA